MTIIPFHVMQSNVTNAQLKNSSLSSGSCDVIHISMRCKNENCCSHSIWGKREQTSSSDWTIRCLPGVGNFYFLHTHSLSLSLSLSMTYLVVRVLELSAKKSSFWVHHLNDLFLLNDIFLALVVNKTHHQLESSWRCVVSLSHDDFPLCLFGFGSKTTCRKEQMTQIS